MGFIEALKGLGLTLLAFVILQMCGFFISPPVNSPAWVLSTLKFINYFMALQVSISISLFILFIHKRIPLNRLTFWKKRNSFPEMPAEPNKIVIGAFEEKNKKSYWIGLDKKALGGNLLITGSIGSGKSAGAILPVISQVLTNFDPKPSLLAIDPKGTFIKQTIELTQKNIDPENVLHMTLGGRVTFNPIFRQNGLRGASFVETAFMLKSAAANFVGGSEKQDAIWDVLASNLLKNALVYCAAKYSYYTLNDLYKTIITARDGDLVEELKKIVSEGRFTPEEKFNISASINYFEFEFKKLDEKIRSSILITATSFLSQFQEYQASQIFCPSEKDLTIKDMDEVVDVGQILLFDIIQPGLARSMGTLIKLLYQQSILKRVSNPLRKSDRLAVLVCDEYQDVASTGNIGDLGDNTFTAKGREANAVTIVAFQSYASLENSVGSSTAVKELLQNFRTRIACHSSDSSTIQAMKELFGEEIVNREAHGLSETSPNANRNLLLGGFDSKTASLSESVTTSQHKEYPVTAKEFSRLETFEAFSQVYDGISTFFCKLFLKPYYLIEKNISHQNVLLTLRVGLVAVLLTLFTIPVFALEFPNVCSVAKSLQFTSCTGMTISSCMCPGTPPRPCAHFSYYVPQTFIEVSTEPGDSYFDTLPGASSQLLALKGMKLYGAQSDDDTHSFHAHTIPVPFASIFYKSLPCDGIPVERPCFEGMSEHLGPQWSSGSGDLLQPLFLAWSLSPKMCLLKGAAKSFMNDPTIANYPTTPGCSTPMTVLPKFPPSSHSACNGWGTFYPRSGSYNGESQTVGALMIASRIKSLSTEVFHTTPGSSDEYYQMLSPQTSSCFREGHNVGFLETIKNVRETKRLLNQNQRKFLFVVWQNVSCCKDLTYIATTEALLTGLQASCQGDQSL
jgi:hypothetical protein